MAEGKEEMVEEKNVSKSSNMKNMSTNNIRKRNKRGDSVHADLSYPHEQTSHCSACIYSKWSLAWGHICAALNI